MPLLLVQAVQLLPEHETVPGQVLHLTASHDTYAICFAIDSCVKANAVTDAATSSSSDTSMGSGASSTSTPGAGLVSSSICAAAQPTGVPMYDPAWKAAYDNITHIQGQLVKAITQDPLEYRRMVCAALLLAIRPWGSTAGLHDADSKQRQGGDNAVVGHHGGRTWPTADPHHAAAMLVRLMI